MHACDRLIFITLKMHFEIRLIFYFINFDGAEAILFFYFLLKVS